MPNSNNDFEARFVEALLNKRAVKRLTKRLSLKELELVVMDVEGVYRERKRDEEEKQEKLERARKRYQEVSKSDTTAKKTVIRYRFTDEKGVLHEWSGHGHTPSEFKEKLKTGVTLEELEVKKD